ncbi:uncharacterized protein LOC120345269 [Styela clava]
MPRELIKIEVRPYNVNHYHLIIINMCDKNFQQFLEVLNEVEAKGCGERRLQPIPEICVLQSRDERGRDRCPVLPEIKTIKSKHKPVFCPLRKPGFVYRSKNFSRKTFLDNNLWELMCGRKVLRSPTFKYREKRKSLLSPYTLQALDRLCELTIDAKTLPTCGNSKPKNLAPITTTSHKNAESSFGNKFLPLSKSNTLPMKSTKSHFPTRRKQVIQSSKFSTEGINSREQNTIKLVPQDAGFKNWADSASGISFKDLASTKDDEVCDNIPRFEIGSPSYTQRTKNEQYQSSKLTPINTTNLEHSTSNITPNSSKPILNIERSCSFQARMCEQDMSMSVDELSSYMEDFLFLPQKMSSMAEMMYT